MKVSPQATIMRRLTTVLPQKARLELENWRRELRGLYSIVPNFNQIKRARAGSKLSLVFRHIFEHKHTRKIFGSNLAVLMLASSLIPTTHAYDHIQADQAYIVQEQSMPLTTNTNVRFPVESIRITQGYHFFHAGIDFDGDTGDPITPILPGVVTQVQYSRFAYGNAILVDHGGGVTSLYAHLSKILVAQGQEVDQFTKIGEMGSTGYSSGDHLHLEVREGGNQINPLILLPEVI